MRLFELAGSRFQDDLVNLLTVMQGRANSKKTQSVIPWPALNNMLKMQGYGEINQDVISKIQDQIDPNGDLIQNVTDSGIVLKTDKEAPEEPTSIDMPKAKSIDQMASNVVKKEFG